MMAVAEAGLRKILVSACLLGEKVRYDGCDAAAQHPILADWCARGLVIPFCPEVAGGLPVPREAAEIKGGSGADVLDGSAFVWDRSGRDVTAAFLEGARKALAMARSNRVSTAILKEKSPSCATLHTYAGSFQGKLEAGTGVTAALLQRHGIAVFNEHQLAKAAQHWARELA